MTGVLRRVWPRILAALFALLLPALLPSSPQPNIVFLYADDLAAWAIGGLGNGEARTAHIDRLYAEGVGLSMASATSRRALTAPTV